MSAEALTYDSLVSDVQVYSERSDDVFVNQIPRFIMLAGRVFVLESVTGGVRLVPLSKFLPCDWADRPEWTEEELERAMSVCGEPYSQIEAMLGVLDATDDTNGKWQCSEFVKWACRLDCRATPSAVMDYALETGSAIREIQP